MSEKVVETVEKSEIDENKTEKLSSTTGLSVCVRVKKKILVLGP